jgi:hypothetical protein
MNDPKAQDSAAVKPKQGGVSAGAIVFGLVLLAIIGRAAYVWINSPDGDFDFREFAFLGKPELKLYPVTGEVYFNGELLKEGHLEAFPTVGKPFSERVVALIDKQTGKFNFVCEIDTKLAEGLPVGDYKVLLLLFHPSPGLGAPNRKLPDKYYSVAETPLAITVTTDPAKNHFV